MINDKKITAHVIVKNEDKYVWFAIMSVIDYVDYMIIFDTGSTDNTVKIIESIINQKEEYRNKITFEKKGVCDRLQFAKLRQEQLDRTNTEYILVLDGDEIYWQETIKEIKKIINSENDVLLIATKFINCAYDIYHYRDSNRDSYHIENENCAITVHLFSKNIPGLHVGGIYGNEGYHDLNENDIQNHGYKTIIQNKKFLHTSYLRRSSYTYKDMKVFSRFKKLFTGYDYKFDKDFKYPEVFYMDYPDFVENPLKKSFNLIHIIIHFFLDILKIRKIVQHVTKEAR